MASLRKHAGVGRSATTADRAAASPLLACVSTPELEELMREARERRLEAREWLFRHGDSADACFVVLTGRLEVLVDTEGGPRVARVLGPGATLGELALLTGERRSASVRALRDSRLLEIDAERFTALLERDPPMAVALARELARQLQASGGLETPEARVAVVTVTGDAADGVAAELARALRRFGAAEILDAGGLAPEEFAPAVDAAEAKHAYVLLVDAGADEAWSSFCRRQADRVLVVVRAGTAVAAGPPGCDAVFVDVPPAQIASTLGAMSPRAHHVVPGGSGFAPAVARIARRLTGRSLGVVLSGGGARGFAHIGAIAVLAEADLEIDRYGGCSMGSFIAAMAACGRSADEIAEHCRTELVRRSPFNDYTLPRVALIRSRKAGVMLQRIFGDALVEGLERQLFTVSADLLSSRLVVHRRGRVLDAVGASMSIPGVAPPVRGLGGLLVDGGVLNNLPVDEMAETGEGPIVAVDVIRRLDAPGAGEDAPLPSITETLARATVLGSVERAEHNRSLAQLLIAPDVQDVALREWGGLDRAIAAGRRAAEASLAGRGLAELRAALEAGVT